MKRILITGANSYIGTSFEKWMTQWPEEYQVDSVGTRNDEWVEKDFSGYDVVFHVAGIAHIKETKQNEHFYYEVNRDMAINIAKKAKIEKVKQFIFLSSMSVYGVNEGAITKNTITKPKSVYGISKLEAEKGIEILNDEDFFVAILRPPMIYGKGCKGNYKTLSSFAKITPIFPKIENKRSMLFIDTLSEFVKKIIDKNGNGIYFPQNDDYVNTSEMINIIAQLNGGKIKFVNWVNKPIDLMKSKITILNKVFGDLYYEDELSEHSKNISENSFYETIKLSEK